MTRQVLAVRGLTVRKGGQLVLDGVSFEVSAGETLALMGESGSGKTSLLRALAGLDPFEAGDIVVGNTALTARPCGPSPMERREIGHRIGMVFQFHHLFDNLSVRENVMLAPVHVHGHKREAAAHRASELLSTLGVAHRADAKPRALSGGEAQRVAIARALAVEPDLLLLDEPTASLDAARRDDLATLLKTLVVRHRALIVATHDEAFASACATRVLRLVDGRLVAATA